MAVSTYNKLALDWEPAGQRDWSFRVLAACILLLVLVLAVVLSSIPVPEQDRRQRAAVPERVARFIAEQPEPPPPVEQPKPKPPPPPEPEPEPEPTPTVQRERPSEREPLTEEQQTAREKAESSGLLALRNELSGMMDTSELRSAVSTGLSEQSGDSDQAAGYDADAITAGAATGGGGAPVGDGGAQLGNTQLSEREIAAVRSGLYDGTPAEDGADDRGDADQGSGPGRSQEDVSIVFDQNKGRLYSLYARERRRSPGLEGKIVLEITIAPNGSVTDVEIVSSELNNPSLEAGIISRIKMFKFEAKDVEEMTVTYPIEFLPS